MMDFTLIYTKIEWYSLKKIILTLVRRKTSLFLHHKETIYYGNQNLTNTFSPNKNPNHNKNYKTMLHSPYIKIKSANNINVSNKVYVV